MPIKKMSNHRVPQCKLLRFRKQSFIGKSKDVLSPEKDKIRRVLLEKNVLSQSLTNSYKNYILKSVKRAKRLSSSSTNSSDIEYVLPQKRTYSSVKSTQNSRVTILSDVRVNYSRDTLQTLAGTPKYFNISTDDIRRDFKELCIPNKSLPSVSNTDGNIRVNKVVSQNLRDYFINLSDDSDENIF